ncbi:MAG: TAXI family TRAP transporter solute-binding subunit [Alphaproteobacteria bacterium]
MTARATSWRCLAFLTCLCSVQVSVAGQLSAQDIDAPGSYLLGTATTGGTYHPVGVALSTLIKLKLLPQFGIDLTAVNTDGSQENVGLLRDNEIQFAILSGQAGHEARSGTGDFAGAGPDDNLRAITTLWLSTDHFLVRDDAVKSGTISDFLDLKNRPVSLGREESSTLIENRALMSAFGVDVDQSFDLVELGYAESADALAGGRIDGMSVSGGVPIGAVQEAFDQLGGRAALLDVSDEQLASIDGGRGLWQRVVIPSGTYAGQDRDIYTIGTPNILAVRADVDEEVVYQITRTIFEELEYLHGLHNTTRQISLDNAVNSLPLPIHAGAARYFEEKGVVLPLPPVQLRPDLLVRYPSVEQARVAANQGAVSMFAGTEGDTSTRVAAELASALASGGSGVRLLTTNGGGIDRNLTDLLYLRGVDTAIVRADTLNYAKDQGIYPTVDNQVNYISEMFPEEVHLLVSDDIGDLGDLAGKRVNLGAADIGSSVTASVVLSQLGIRAEPTFFPPRVAIAKLEQGEIAGAFFVGGKPMPLLKEIDGDSGLKLIAVPAVDYFGSYTAAEIPAEDYPNLMEPDALVPTIAVRTALLTYAWRPDSPRYEALASLSGALFDTLSALQESGFHPKWREVDPTSEFAGWRRFPPAALWIDDNEGTARRIATEGRLLIEQDRTQRAADSAAEPPLTGAEAEEPAEAEAPAIDTDVEEEPQGGVAATLEPETPSATAADEGENEEAVDAAVVPTTPPAEATPPSTAEPAAETSPIRNGAALGGGAGLGGRRTDGQAVLPRPAFSNVPTSGVNAPTF